MSEKIVVCLEKGGARDMAEAFSRRTNTPISEKPGEHLTVLFNSKGVSLTGYGLAYQGDFENMLHRVTNGRLQHEMLVRASKSEKPGHEADRRQQRGINARTPGSCRRHIPGSHVPRKTKVQPDQQKTAAHPEAGAPMLPRDRPFRRRYQRRPG